MDGLLHPLKHFSDWRGARRPALLPAVALMNIDVRHDAIRRPGRGAPRYGWRRGLLTLAVGLTCWWLLTNPRHAGVGRAVHLVHGSVDEIAGMLLLALLFLAPILLGGWLLRRSRGRGARRPGGHGCRPSS